MSDLKIDYVEFNSADIGLSQKFFGDAFGWTFVDYGPDYQAFDNAGLDGGLSGGEGEPGRALVILKADDLEGALERVELAGGKITRPIFSFPGGRRFHFIEPGGNELAIWSEK